MSDPKQITFAQAARYAATPEADPYPYAMLNEHGKKIVKCCADEFYDGNKYKIDAVFDAAEYGANDLIIGNDHSFELRRVIAGRSVFCSFVLDADCFDWFIAE